jgi:hypothetical protein
MGNINEDDILDAISVLDSPRSSNIPTLLKYDAEKIAADSRLEQRYPLTSTRNANLAKVDHISTHHQGGGSLIPYRSAIKPSIGWKQTLRTG